MIVEHCWFDFKELKFKCTRCGGERAVKLPSSVAQLNVLDAAFVIEHENCEATNAS